MGRPLKKDVNGVNVTGTFTGDAGIKVTGYFAADTGSAQTYWLHKQKGAKTFSVTRNGTTFFTGVLQSSTANADGEISMTAFLNSGADATEVFIAKITKRVVTDFSGNRYTWRLINYADSTGDQIELTAI